MLNCDFFQENHSMELKNLMHDDCKELFNSDECDVLLYIFPLIERLIIEILDVSSSVNIEIKEQGSIRTINSLLHEDDAQRILGEQLVKRILKYFQKDGLRNQMMHYIPGIDMVSTNVSDVREIKNIAIELANLYENQLKKIDSITVEKISTIKQ